MESQVSGIQPLQNISTSSIGKIGVIIEVINFLLILIVNGSFFVFGNSLGISPLFVFIPIVLAILGILLGVKGLLEKPTSRLSWWALILGVIEIIPPVLVGGILISNG